jgi:hypothetical protein
VLDKVVFDNYLEGLNEAGLQVDRSVVRLVFAVLAALKYGALPIWLRHVQDETKHSIWEEHLGFPMEEFVHQQAVLTYHLLDLAGEARRLV